MILLPLVDCRHHRGLPDLSAALILLGPSDHSLCSASPLCHAMAMLLRVSLNGRCCCLRCPSWAVYWTSAMPVNDRKWLTSPMVWAILMLAKPVYCRQVALLP